MRAIESEMLKAWNNETNFHKSNTAVIVDADSVRVYLFGHCIARKSRETGATLFSLCGWNTVTTRSRLNALGCGVYCRNYTPYRNGAEWWED